MIDRILFRRDSDPNLLTVGQVLQGGRVICGHCGKAVLPIRVNEECECGAYVYEIVYETPKFIPGLAKYVTQ